MIETMDFTLPVCITTFLLLAFLYNLLFKKGSTQRPPEVGAAWPIIGHLHLLTGPRPPQKVFADMADKYGPIFQLRLGAHKILVVSDSRIAKECFTTNDRAIAGRPKAIAVEIMGYNYAIFGLASYGPYWREVRKVVQVELLSSRCLERLKHLRESRIKTLNKNIYQTWLRDKNESEELRLDLKQWYSEQFMDVTMQMLFGQRYEEEGSRTVETMRKFFDLLGATAVGDFLPWLRWSDIGGHKKAMKETAKELDIVMESLLQEHKRKRHMKPKEDEDFMDALISRYNGDKVNGFDADTVVKATCLAMLSAATDTTTVTTIWALSLIMNNPRVLKKIQTELDIHVGRERPICLSDLNNLTYIQAIVKETLRLYPPAPLLLPHEAIEDCIINGYYVSKGMRILVNAFKLHRDPGFWSDPDEFRPERFLSEHKDIDVRGNHFELIPFGSGRRMCLGISLALQMVELAIASLIQGFDLKRTSDEPIDLTESSGLTSIKATPLYVLLTPHLPSHLYY